MTEQIMEPVGHFFNILLKIKRNPNGVQAILDNCYEAIVPDGVIDEINSDMIIFVTTQKSDALAWAVACNVDDGSLRPNAAQIN